MKNIIKYGLLSTAQIGLNAHLPASIESENSEIISISSRGIEKAKISAEKYDLKGTVRGIDDKVTVELAGTRKDDKTNRNGEFKLNNVLEGEYNLQVIADKKVIHEQSIKVDSDDDNLEINVGSSSAVVDKTVISAAAANSVNQEVSSVPVPQTA